MEDKSFMENAEGFLGSWKDDYAKKNKHILDRAQKRRNDAEAMHQQFLKDLEEVGKDLEGTAKDVYAVVIENFNGFSQALKEGTATIKDKLELEQKFEQLSMFMETAGKAGTVKFKQISADLSKKLNEFNTEFSSEKVEGIENNKKEKKEEVGSGIDKLHDNVKDMFKDFL